MVVVWLRSWFGQRVNGSGDGAGQEGRATDRRRRRRVPVDSASQAYVQPGQWLVAVGICGTASAGAGRRTGRFVAVCPSSQLVGACQLGGAASRGGFGDSSGTGRWLAALSARTGVPVDARRAGRQGVLTPYRRRLLVPEWVGSAGTAIQFARDVQGPAVEGQPPGRAVGGGNLHLVGCGETGRAEQPRGSDGRSGFLETGDVATLTAEEAISGTHAEHENVRPEQDWLLIRDHVERRSGGDGTPFGRAAEVRDMTRV